MHWLKTLSEQLRKPHDSGKKDKIRFVAEFSAKEEKFYLSNIFWSNHKKNKSESHTYNYKVKVKTSKANRVPW